MKEDTMQELILFEKEELLESMDNDIEFMCSILDETIESLPNELDILRSHVEADDAAATRNQAHTMKGLSANIYAPALRDVCLRIETAAKEGDLKTASEILPELERVISLTISEIKNRCL